MILFKACPRCGGDIDATYADDIHCVQCSHRPQVAYPGPRIISSETAAQDSTSSAVGVGEGLDSVGHGPAELPAPSRAEVSTDSCPRCEATEPVRLDKLREQDNTCYRCRTCGHIFSPGSLAAANPTAELSSDIAGSAGDGLG